MEDLGPIQKVLLKPSNLILLGVTIFSLVFTTLIQGFQITDLKDRITILEENKSKERICAEIEEK